MTRRDFIILAQGLGLSAWFGDMAFAQVARTQLVRKSATAQAAAADIETLRKGVKALLAVSDATKYASWMYWANSHCTPDPIPPAMKPVWCRCTHTPPDGPLNLNFLPWHRAYLFFFEALIRELTQQAAFALPYWDWYAAKTIPPAFAGDQNPLNWDPRRYSNRTLLRSALTKKTYDEFSGALEGNPHGSVHVMVGGDMAAVVTSARDPVFWAHHGNIDRLWSVWLAADSNNKNPTDANWKAQPFVFDLAGQKRLTVAALLATEDLGYKYDNLQPAATTDAVPARPTNVKAAPASPNLNMMMMMNDALPHVLSTSNQVDLSASVNLAMKVPDVARDRLSKMTEGASGDSPKLALVLQGFHVTEAGRKLGFEYRIYINLPAAPSAEDKHDDFFVGVINSFQLSHHADERTVLVFPIERLAPALAKRGLWKPDEVNIALVTDETEAKEPLVTIGNVGLFVAQAPITPEAMKALSK